MTLTALVGRIMAGEGLAEEEFIDRYASGVKAIVRHTCSNRSVVDDLCQEALKTALEKIRAGSVRDPERLSGFVASLARNLVIELARRDDSRRSALNEKGYGPFSEPADPLEQLLQAERAAIVRGVLDELTAERDREILFRFYLEEQDKDEICAALGLTREHFNRVLFRARERYRDQYQRKTANAIKHHPGALNG